MGDTKMSNRFDLAILGGGPGGYIAAERAGARGKRVLLVERGPLGGVCLNEGCIPTKTLLHAAKTYQAALHGASVGVHVDGLTFGLADAMAWKKKVIETLRKGIASQMKRFGVTVVEGHGRLVGPGALAVDKTEYQADNILLCTGSSSVVPPIPGADGPGVVTSGGLLEIEKMPESVVVVGGGYIGMEFASFFSSVGAKVTVIEMMDEIIPFMDKDLAKLLRQSVKGVDYHLGSKVLGIEAAQGAGSAGGNGASDGGGQGAGTRSVVSFETAGKEGTSSVEGDVVLVAAGRRPNVENNGFEEAGLDVDRGGVTVDEFMKTNLPGVYAAGDVTGKSLLAHSASRMGEVAVNTMFGTPGPAPETPARYKDRMRYHAIPWVVFTAPEVAGCGMTEQEAVEAGIEVESVSMSMKASGRYLAEHPKERGTIKAIVEKGSEKVLGVHMLGSGSSELIFGAAMMIETELRGRDIREMIFPHPTVSEVLRDAMWEIDNERRA